MRGGAYKSSDTSATHAPSPHHSLSSTLLHVTSCVALAQSCRKHTHNTEKDCEQHLLTLVATCTMHVLYQRSCWSVVELSRADQSMIEASALHIRSCCWHQWSTLNRLVTHHSLESPAPSVSSIFSDDLFSRCCLSHSLLSAALVVCTWFTQANNSIIACSTLTVSDFPHSLPTTVTTLVSFACQPYPPSVASCS